MPPRPAAREAPVELRVVGGLSAEPLCAVKVDRFATVQEAKAAIEKVEGTPWEGQHLVLEGRPLDNQVLLKKVLPARVTSVQVALIRLNPAKAAAIRSLHDGRVELEDLDGDLQADRDVVLAAVRADGHALRYADEALRGDSEVVMAAVLETGMALRHATGAALQDRQVVLTAVGSHREALFYTPEALRADPEVVLRALRGEGAGDSVLRYAAESLRDEHGFMEAAVRESPTALRFASERLKRDRGLVLAAVGGYPEALFAAGEQLQGDRVFVLELVKRNGCAVAHAAPRVREDAHILAAAMENTPEALAWLRRVAPNVRNKLIRDAQALKGRQAPWAAAGGP